MTTKHVAFFLCVLCVSAATLSSSSPRAAQQDPARAEVRIGVLRPGGGYTVQTIALETYIARVLAGEAARDSRPAALEALAIAIRTYVLANPGRHSADGFDLCDQTHCQVMRTPGPAHEHAAAATAGQALLRGGVPVPVLGTWWTGVPPPRSGAWVMVTAPVIWGWIAQ